MSTSRNSPTRQHRPTGHPRARPVGRLLALLAVPLLALNLRPGASGVGPILPQVSEAIGVGRAAEGLLAAMPCLVFGIVGWLAVPFARRVGVSGALVIGAIASAIGLALRPAMDSLWPFLLATAVGLGGAALGNVLVPAWVKRHTHSRVVIMMTVYSVMLSVGGAAGTFLAVPLMGLAPDSAPFAPWQLSLEVWSWAFVVAALLWLVVLARVRFDFPREPATGSDTPRGSLRRSPTAWAMTLLFGLQSTNAYVQFAFVPGFLMGAGMSAPAAGMLTATIQLWGIVGGLLMPTVIDRWGTLLRWFILAFGLVTTAGYLGLWLAPQILPALWVTLLGIGGLAFPTVIAMIPDRTRDPAVTARLSGMVQPVGYLLAAIGPLVVGVVMQVTGATAPALVILAVGGLGLGAVGLVAGRPAIVDDELA